MAARAAFRASFASLPRLSALHTHGDIAEEPATLGGTSDRGAQEHATPHLLHLAGVAPRFRVEAQPGAGLPAGDADPGSRASARPADATGFAAAESHRPPDPDTDSFSDACGTRRRVPNPAKRRPSFLLSRLCRRPLSTNTHQPSPRPLEPARADGKMTAADGSASVNAMPAWPGHARAGNAPGVRGNRSRTRKCCF